MKKIAYWEDKAKKIWEERGIDMSEIVELIENGKILSIMPNPWHPNQKRLVLDYHGYVIGVPYVEDEEQIFLKTAYYDRKLNKQFNH